MNWPYWAWRERVQLRLGDGGCWAGWAHCLKGPGVLSEVAAAAAAADWSAEVVAAVVQVDADVAAPHC